MIDVEANTLHIPRRPAPLRTGWGVAMVLLTVLVGARVAAAQTLEGRILDQDNAQPVGGALVTLVDVDGTERARTLADSTGRFVLAPPEPEELYVVAEGFGYHQTRSPLIAFRSEGRAEMELMLVPEPIGLEGLEVSAEEQAVEELGLLGLTPAELGNRWIDGEAIDAIQVKRDAGVILERTAQTGIQVLRPDNETMGSGDLGLCVSFWRTRRGDVGRCALIVLNGVPISTVGALDIDPGAIRSMAVLEPMEATTHYGTVGGAGAVLIWTGSARR